MARQIGNFRRVTLTGTTGAITGGDIIPSGSIMAIWGIDYSELNTTGNTVTVRGNPSLNRIDQRFLLAGGRVDKAIGPYPMGTLPGGDAIQVLTDRTNTIVACITYTIEQIAEFVP